MGMHHISSLLLVWFCLNWHRVLVAQDDAKSLQKIDSLENVLTQPLENHQKLDVWNELMVMKSYTDSVEATAYFEKMTTLAQHINSDSMLSKAYYNLAWTVIQRRNYQEGRLYLIKSRDYARKTHFPLYEGKVLHGLAVIAGREGNFPKRLRLMQEYLEIVDKLEDKIEKAGAYSDVSYSYRLVGNYEEAIIYSKQSLEYMIALKDSAGIATCYNALATSYRHQGALEGAIDFYFKALRMNEMLGLLRKVAFNYHNIGRIYLDLEMYDKAKEFLFRVLEIKLNIKAQKAAANSMNNIGNIYRIE